MDGQFEFDFSGNATAGSGSGSESGSSGSGVRGYDVEAEIASEWGLPLGQTVHLWTKNPEQEWFGRLELAEIPPTIDRRQVLHLRIKGHRFDSRNIASWRLP